MKKKTTNYAPHLIIALILLCFLCSCGTSRNGYGCPHRPFKAFKAYVAPPVDTGMDCVASREAK